MRRVYAALGHYRDFDFSLRLLVVSSVTSGFFAVGDVLISIGSDDATSTAVDAG